MYLTRIAETQLSRRLQSAGIVVLEGPKACGKTETARQYAASEVLLDVDEEARRALQVDPALVLAGERPRLIDEWQVAPELWNHMRRAVDDAASMGQFLLTGSAMPADDITRHTGAGRIARVRLRPMSLFEMGISTGAASLGRMMAGEPQSCPDTNHTVAALAELVCRGGWPGNVALPLQATLDAQRDYLQEIQRTDIARVDGVRRDPYNVERVVRSLARNVSTTVAASTLATDAGGADGALDQNTVRDYLHALRRLMILEEQPAWAPHLRSRSLLRKSPKRHLADPSLAVAALGANPDQLLKDLRLFGFLFESLVARDLSVYAQNLDASLYHYRDNTGFEIDAIVQDRQGNWCAFEIKLGKGQVDEAAANLLKLRDRVDFDRTGEPGTLGVIVGSGYGYVRDDGIAVVPVGALGP